MDLAHKETTGTDLSDLPFPEESADSYIGARVRLRRKSLGLSQGDLGKYLGVTFQQIQKYERGTNHISAVRLVHISKVLSAPVDYFLGKLLAYFPEGAPAHGFAESEQASLDNAPESPKRVLDYRVFDSPEAIELVGAYNNLTDPGERKALRELVRRMAKMATKE